MDELYMEQVVSQKVSLGVKIIRAVILLVTIASCISVAFYTEMVVVTCALAFLGFTFNVVTNIQYEYIYEKDSLCINRIDGWKKKRKAATVDLNHVEMIVPKGSHRLGAYKNMEIFDFSAKDESENPYVMVVSSKMGIKKLVFQFDEDMIENFKIRMPRKVFSD